MIKGFDLLFGRYLIEIYQEPEVTAGGIIVPKGYNKFLKGTIVAMADDCPDNPIFTPFAKDNNISFPNRPPNVGDLVVIKRGSGTEITINNKLHRILIQDNFLLFIDNLKMEIR